MTSVADLVRVLHDIDATKERTCGNCHYRNAWGGHCRLGHGPAGLDDGCDDFRWKPQDAFKGWPGTTPASGTFHGISTPFHGRASTSARDM